MAINLIQGKQIATASWAENSISSSFATTSSYALTASFASNYTLTSSFNQFTQSYNEDSSSFDVRVANNSESISSLSSSFTSFSSSYNTGSFTGSFTGSLLGTASNAISSLYAETASYTPSISGTDNYLAKFNGTSAIENSLIYDDGTNVGIGTTSPAQKLQVEGTIRVGGGYGGSKVEFSGNNVQLGLLGDGQYRQISYLQSSTGTGNTIRTDNYTTTSTAFLAKFQAGTNDRMVIKQTGEVGIGKSTPSATLDVNGNTLITGSLNVTNGITGSLFGTASFAISSSQAQNAQTSSYLNTLNQDLTFNGNLVLNGTASISTLVVNQTQYSSGSNQLGDGIEDTQTLFGTVIIPTGSLTVTGSVISTQGFTGSLLGTSSFAISSSQSENANTASYAPDYVPYIGATQDVDLGAYSLSTPIIVNNFNQDYYSQIRLDGIGVSLTTEDLSSGDSNTFDTLPSKTYSKRYVEAPGFQVLTGIPEPVEAGKIIWNSADGTFDMGLLNGVTLQAGQEIHMYAKASGAISNGDAVQFAGAQGDHLLIKKAVPSEITANPEYFVGVATQDFSNNEFGYVTVFGQVRDLDTDAYSEGTVLYFDSMGSTAGLLTDVRPTGPNAKIIVAAVVRSHQNQGSLFVRPHVMPMIGDLQNVEINTGSLATGDILTYNSSSQVWSNTKQLSGSYGLTGSLQATSFTGSLLGNATTATTASYAATSSFTTAVSGTTNYVPKFTASETLGNSQIYDNGTNVGIGTTSPSAKFQVESSDSTTRIRIKNNNASLNAGIEIRDLNNLFKGGFLGSSTNMGFYGPGGNFPGIELSNNDAIAFRKQSDGQTNMYLSPTGLLGIGTTSPSSKLHLVDTALAGSGALSGSVLNLEQTWNTTGTPTLIKANVTDTTSPVSSLLLDLQAGGISRFRVRKDGQLNIINTFLTDGMLNLNAGNTVLSLMPFSATGNASVLVNAITTTATSGQKVFADAGTGLAPTSGNATLISFLSRPTINQTGGANGITRGLFINPTLTSAADWRSIELTNNTGFGIYQSGTAKNSFAGNVGIGTTTPSAKLDVQGDILIKSANISNQENLDVDTGTEVVATVAIADYDAAFFDFVIKNGTNLRAGTVYAVHDGTNVEYTETSTSDLGNTSDVTLSVDISSGNMRLLATTTTDNWIVKSLVRAI